MMINTKLFNVVAFVYLVASLLYLYDFFFRKESIGKAAKKVTWLGIILQTLAFFFRWIESYQLGIGHSPFIFFTLYEILVFACWIMAIVYLIVENRYCIRTLGVIILPIISLGMLYASLSPHINSSIKELPMVLKSNFYIQHALSTIMGYSAFGFSCVLSILILLMGIRNKKFSSSIKLLTNLPSQEFLDDLSYKAIAIGFILSSIGMATGLYRTKVIWDSYWNWDPSQTLGLITWLLYALILHGRYQRWWGMKITAMLSIIAFIGKIVLFLIAGNYMMRSGHYPIL